MSGETKPIQTAGPDPRDLKIQEQTRTIAELTAQVKELEENSATLSEKLAKLESLLASQVQSKSSKTPVFTDNYSADRNKTNEKKTRIFSSLAVQIAFRYVW